MYNGYNPNNGYDPNSLSTYTNYNNSNNFVGGNKNNEPGESFLTVIIAFLGLVGLICFLFFATDIFGNNKKYTVTYMNSEKVYLVQDNVKENSTLLEPAPPTREGYMFMGWYLDNEPYVFGSPVTSDLYLRARWVNLDTNKIE